MKKLTNIISWVAFAGVIAIALGYFTMREKVAYIDTNELLRKYDGMKDARAAFEKKADVWKANSDSLLTGWEKELKAYEKERKSMSPKERELKEQLLRNKQQQIGQYRQAMQQKAADEEQTMTQSVVNEVNDYITAYGKKHGYTFIYGANGSGNIVYAKKAYNLTEEIREGLNKEYQSRKK